MASFINMNNYNDIDNDFDPEERLHDIQSLVSITKNLMLHRDKMTPSQLQNMMKRLNELENMINF